MKNQPAIALVIGLCSHGIAMTRALHKQGVNVHALEAKPWLPGVRTKTAKVHYVKDINAPSLINDLLAFRHLVESGTDIILFPTNDNTVRILAEHITELRPHFKLSWMDAASQVLNLLLKSNIEKRCIEKGIRYPQSTVIHQLAELGTLAAAYDFPVLIKPVKPQSGFKALRCDDLDALKKAVSRFQNDLPILMQNWIDGGDQSLFFGALYLDKGQAITRFCGNKLESHPPAMGQTTVAISCHDDEVLAITEHFFEGSELSGPVSLELKKDSRGRYWVIEPTVGRTDFWVGLCVGAGDNILFTEYCHTMNLSWPAPVPQRPAIWFDSEKDLLAVFRHGKKYLCYGSNGRYHPVFSYFSLTDLRPFGAACLNLASRVPPHLRKKLSIQTAPEKQESRFTVHAYQGYPALPDQARAFLSRHAQADIFTESSWYENFCQTVTGRDNGVCFLCLYQNSSLLAILPIWKRHNSNPRQMLKMISSLTNYYTPIFKMNSDSQLINEDDARLYFLNYLQHHFSWDIINLSPMTESDAKRWQAIAQGIKQPCFSYFASQNQYEDNILNFDEYMQQRPSRLRNTIQRKVKKLNKMRNWQVDIIHPSDSPSDRAAASQSLEDALRHYHDVYNLSWKKSEPYPEFINGLARMSLENGWLRLGILYIDAKPAAVQIWLVKDRTAYIYKLAYAKTYCHYSPGTILTYQLMKHVIQEDKVHKIDFLIGSETFKTDWMTCSRDLYGIQVVNRARPIGFFYYLRNLASEWRKYWRRMTEPNTWGHTSPPGSNPRK